MKYIFVILSLTGLLSQNLSRLVILVNFELNKEFIAKNLCEKKEEVDNCCKGSCHLKKQLDEDEKKQPVPTQNTKDKYEVQLYCNKLSFELNDLKEKSEAIKQKQILYSKLTLCSVFHPPQA